MFRRLRIQNFKAWRDTGDIRLARSRFSSAAIAQAKAACSNSCSCSSRPLSRQTVAARLAPRRPAHPRRPWHVSGLVYDHNLDNRVQFELGWELPDSIAIQDKLSAFVFSGAGLSFSANVSAGSKTEQPVLQSFEYVLSKGESTEEDSKVVLSAGMRSKKGQPGQYQLTRTRYPFVRKPGRAWPLPPPSRFYGFPDEVFAYYQNAHFVSDLSLLLEQQFRRIQYLGPLRNRPSRMYTWAGEVREHVGWTGEWAVEALLAPADREMNFGPEAKIPASAADRRGMAAPNGTARSFETR